uniref:NRF domain-containing protein n=1 Tax=Caenorhabditis tropicalis TaxID=1561998 RepID=A0A1I7SXM5_9PELO
MTRSLFSLFLLLTVCSEASAGWKDIFIPKPFKDLSPQCQNETNIWIKSLEIFATISTECTIRKKCSIKELQILEDNLYAVQQLDAFGQFPGSGVLELKTLYDGSNQECQRISGKKYETNYCYLLLSPGKNVSCAITSSSPKYDYLPWRIAVCLPYSCNHTDMVEIFNQMSPYPFTACSAFCVALGDTLKPALDFPNHLWNHLLLSAFVSVDTFFIMSGIVVAYLFFKMKPTRKTISNPMTWILFYVHRYLRLTPPMMLFIGFFTVYGPYIQGSFAASEFNQIFEETALCKTYWWHNLLYFNNFDTTTESSSKTCYNISWYLAVDTQLYLIAPIILIAFFFSFSAGTTAVVTGCLGSIITTYILYSEYNLSADGFGNGNGNDLNRIAYSKPWIRCPPYLVGLFTGYLLAVYGSRKIRLNWALCICGWIAAFVIAGFCIFSSYDYDKGSKWSVFTRATYYNFDRLGWAFFICWVVGANHMGWGGPINNFMSHPIWQPFGRLSYCAYIVHWMFLYVSIPATLLAYVFAFFWSCLFEIPTLKLEKMLIEALIGGGGRTSLKVGDAAPKINVEVKKNDEENKQITELENGKTESAKL